MSCVNVLALNGAFGPAKIESHLSFFFPLPFLHPNEKRFYHLRKKIFFSSSSLTLLAVVVDDASPHPQGSPFAGGETLTDR